MDIQHYIGIDVSKNTLDWAVYAHHRILWHTQSENTPLAIRDVIKQLKALPGFQLQSCICCLEHTGIYNAPALEVLNEARFPLWLEASLQIKQAGGLQRGKSDRIDAQRIAEYARAGGPVSVSGSDPTLATSPAGVEKTHGTQPASTSLATDDQPVANSLD